MIEHGRYQIDHLPRENRLCPLCNSNQVEDEIHFFFQCITYSVQRQAFINQSFVSSCMKIRVSLLEM